MTDPTMQLWMIYFTYDDHETETEAFVHPANPRPSTEDARAYLLSIHTNDDGDGYMQDALDDPELLTVEDVTPFGVVTDIEGKAYKVVVQA